MFDSRASTFSSSPAMLAVMMFCVFPAVFLQIVLFLLLSSINCYPRDQLRDHAGVLGQQTCPQHPMLF